MFSFAKLWADICKYFGASTGFVTHSIIAIMFSGGSWFIHSVYTDKNGKLELVTIITKKLDSMDKKIDTIQNRFNRFVIANNTGHSTLNANISSGFGDFKAILQKDKELNDVKFRAIYKDYERQFEFQNKWYQEMLNKLPDFSQYEKKNENSNPTALLNHP